MAKKRGRKKTAAPPRNFSLKSLHRMFNDTRDRLNGYKSTAAVRKLKQDLTNAQSMVACPQGMLRDMSV